MTREEDLINLKRNIKKFSSTLKNKIKESKFKNFSEFARASKTKKQGVSRLVNFDPEKISGNQPPVERLTVLKWAFTLKWNVNEALYLSGHAPTALMHPQPKTVRDLLDLFADVKLKKFDDFKDSDIPEELDFLHFKQLLDLIYTNIIVMAKTKNQVLPSVEEDISNFFEGIPIYESFEDITEVESQIKEEKNTETSKQREEKEEKEKHT